MCSNAAGVERIANAREAVAAWLEQGAPGLIACEPTGGYERIVIAAAHERGILFHRVHPNDVIAFRKRRTPYPGDRIWSRRAASRQSRTARSGSRSNLTTN